MTCAEPANRQVGRNSEGPGQALQHAILTMSDHAKRFGSPALTRRSKGAKRSPEAVDRLCARQRSNRVRGNVRNRLKTGGQFLKETPNRRRSANDASHMEPVRIASPEADLPLRKAIRGPMLRHFEVLACRRLFPCSQVAVANAGPEVGERVCGAGIWA